MAALPAVYDGATLSVQGWQPQPLAVPGAAVVEGDFDGKQTGELGYCLNGTTWTLETVGTPQVFAFGFPLTPGNTVYPVVGDWSNSGKTNVGVYCEGAWFLDYDGSHTWDAVNQSHLVYLGWNDGGTNTVIPCPAHWNADGSTNLAVYCGGAWFIRMQPLTSSVKVRPALDGLRFIVEDWGWAGAVPVPADWVTQGDALPAVYNLGTGQWFVNWNFDWNGTQQFQPGQLVYQWGGPGEQPLAVEQT